MKQSGAALADGAVQSPKAAAGTAPNSDAASDDSWSAYEVKRLLGCMQPQMCPSPPAALTYCAVCLYVKPELTYIEFRSSASKALIWTDR